jgi:hypothetical protein
MSGLVFLKWISRDFVRENPDALFVFGDNLLRIGMGGQAASMRGEPNAIGVATKRAPGASDDDFFSDHDSDALALIDADIDRVVAALAEGRTVYVPLDGLGTGLSELPQRAPTLHAHIVERFRAMCGDVECPWSIP